MKKVRYVYRKHIFIYFVVKIFSFLYTRIVYGYRSKAKYHMKKDEPIIVLSNHQTDVDPFCLFTCFTRPIFPIATDNIFAGKFRGRLFNRLGVISKKKGSIDLNTVMSMQKVLSNKGSLLLFLEGNRSFAEFQFYISDSIVKFLKNSKATIVLFNLKGGTGKAPRFKHKRRKGPFTGDIKKILKYEEYSKMDDSLLFSTIKDNLKVFDSESHNLYKSNKRGEYLERVFFVCPVCGKVETLHSKGAYLHCSNCGLKVEYSEDLHLKSDNPDFKFSKMIEYWNYQKRYIKDMLIYEDKVIFSDKNVKVRKTNPYEKKVNLFKGEISLTDKKLNYGKQSFDLSKIESASVVSGRNLTFTYDGNEYTLRGHKRFNALKYIFMFNKLDTLMARNKSDQYYNLEEN